MRKALFLTSMLLLFGTASTLSTQTYAADSSWDNREDEPPIGVVEPAYFLEDRYDSSEKVHVKFNGEVFGGELKSVKLHETIMVPVRDLFKKIGMTTKFDQENLVLTAAKSDKIFEFSLKDITARANGKETTLPRTPFIEQKNNRMFVPLRYVIESEGGTVKWDSKQKTAYVTLKK